jgi:phage gp29-like protein
MAKATIDEALGSAHPTQTGVIDRCHEVIAAARARHSIVIDKNHDLQWKEHGSTGNNIIAELINYCDSKIQLLILGAQLTTSAIAGGSYALGQIHRGELQSIVQYNRIRQEEVLDRDLVMDFFRRNFLEISALGLPMPEPGDLKCKIRVEKEEIKQDAINNAAQSGGEISAKLAQQM